MNRYAVMVFSLLLAGRALHGAENANETDASARMLATQVCSACHGAGGTSMLPTVPNLAAQPRQYLVAKIKFFRSKPTDGADDHADVLGLTLIDDATADALARYFASQPPPTPVPAEQALVAAGNKIFVQGAPDHGVPACAACHGPNAHGFGLFPRLAGQHAEYVQRQLKLIQAKLRDAPVMHGIIKDMTPDEIKAVAAYVQSK